MRNLWLSFYLFSSLIIIFANIINLLSHFCNTEKYGNRKDKPIKNSIGRTRQDREMAGQLGKNEATISRWCSNTSQPSLEMLMKIAELLDVDSRDLIISRK